MRGCHAGCSPWAIRTSQREPTSHRFATTNASPETSISPRPTRSRFAPSIRLNQVERPRAVSAPVAPPPSRLSRCLLRSSQFARPTASRHRTPAAKPKPSAIPTSPDRCVRARLRCSSRASLPFSPQARTPTAIIGVRPATSLRTKTKSVDTTPSGCRVSRVLLRVQCCPRPYRPENALSRKRCERAFSGR